MMQQFPYKNNKDFFFIFHSVFFPIFSMRGSKIVCGKSRSVFEVPFCKLDSFMLIARKIVKSFMITVTWTIVEFNLGSG